MEIQIDAYLDIVRRDDAGKPVYRIVADFMHEFMGQWIMMVTHPKNELLKVTIQRKNGDHVEAYNVPETQYFDAVTNNGTAEPRKTRYTVYGVICAQGLWASGKQRNVANLYIKANHIILHLDW